MVKLAPQIPLTEPISVPASLPVGPEPDPGQVRQDSAQRKLGIQFQNAYWSDNPARYIQEIMPTQYASSTNHYLPVYISNRALYDLLDEMADKDSTIGGTEDTVASQVLAREQRVDAPEGVDAALAEPVVEFVRECIARLAGEWSDALRALLLGSRRHGFAVSEIVYRLDGPRYVIGRIEHRHPGQFDFDTSGALLMNNGTLDRFVVPPDRFILHRNAALYGMPYGQSEIFPLRWAYYFKKCALKAWADGVETFGLPIIVGTIGENLSEKDRRKSELEEIFQALRASSGLVVQEGITIQGVQRGLTQSATPHQALVDYLDRVMVRRLTGSTLTTMENAGTGSLAQAKTHGQVADDRLVAICNALAETITRDVIKPLVRINFGPNAPVPRFIIDTDDSADIYPTLAIISKAAEMGVPVSVAQFREWFGLKPPQDEADTIKPLFIGGGGQPGMDPALGGGALPFSERHPDGCRCGCGTGAKKAFFFDEREERDRVWEEYQRTVNMTASQLERWAANECSRKASLDRSPIERNLELLRTPKSEWTPKHVEWAKKTISFVARMRGNESGDPAGADCDMSKRAISLLNWAYNPGVKFTDGARYVTFASPGRRAIESAYARQIARIAETIRTANKATLSRELMDGAERLRKIVGDRPLSKEDATRAVLDLAAKTRDTTEAAASARLLAARQIAERLGDARPGIGEGRTLSVDDLASPYRDGIAWMVDRKILPRDAVNEVADAASLIRGSTNLDETRRLLRRDILALAESPNAEMTAVFQRNIAAAANQGMTSADYLAAMDEATKGNNLPPFADAYLENVYRTETANVYQAQRLETMADPSVADFVWGVELFSVLDGRTRPSHEALDGVLLRKGSEAYQAWLPGPPYSYQCRCTSAPVMIGEDAEETPGALALVRAIERF